PRCRLADGPGGGSGLLVDEELARAVRHESAAAIMFAPRRSGSTSGGGFGASASPPRWRGSTTTLCSPPPSCSPLAPVSACSAPSHGAGCGGGRAVGRDGTGVAGVPEPGSDAGVRAGAGVAVETTPARLRRIRAAIELPAPAQSARNDGKMQRNERT